MEFGGLTVRPRSRVIVVHVLTKCTIADDWRTIVILHVLGRVLVHDYSGRSTLEIFTYWE